MSYLKYLAFSPNSFVLRGSIHQPSIIGRCEFQRTSTGRPCCCSFDTLLNTSSQVSRSYDIETAWRTRSSRKGDLPAGSQPKAVFCSDATTSVTNMLRSG